MKILNVKGIVILAIALLVIQLVVGLILSPMLGTVIVEGINRASGTKISVSKVSVWPLTMSCSLKDLKVFDPDDEKQRMAWIKKVSVRISPLRLLSKQVVFSSVNVSGAQIDLKGEPDGSFNLQKLARGAEAKKAPAEKVSIIDRFKGKKDWFGRIYEMIKKKSSKEAVEKKQAEIKNARKIKRDVQQLPKGRRVSFKTLSDEYIFQIRNLAVTDSKINMITPDQKNVSVADARIEIRNLGIDPLKGSRFDRLSLRGKVDKDGSSAGDFSVEYSQSFKKGKQRLEFDLAAKSVDLTAVDFIYAESLPVDFNKGVISISSETLILDGALDSENSLSLRGHDIVPGRGQSFSVGVVPLSTICDAMNNVDPVDMKFSITGTVDDPKFSGFQDVLMSVIKPYLANVTGQLKEKGTKALADIIKQKTAPAPQEGEAPSQDAAQEAVETIKTLFKK
jgi:hypothetical protein